MPTSEYLSLNSQLLLNEQALLLNPEIDKVEEHFYFLPTGEIVSKDERGETTIDILKLNRKRLIFWRKKLLEDYLKELKSILEDRLTGQIDNDKCRYAIKQVLKRVISQQNTAMQYSRFGYFMFNKFNIFFAEQLETKQRQAILTFLDLFKKGEL